MFNGKKIKELQSEINELQTSYKELSYRFTALSDFLGLKLQYIWGGIVDVKKIKTCPKCKQEVKNDRTEK